MKDLIRKILMEEMISKINEWKSNIYENGENSYYTLIGINDTNNDMLFLSVSLIPNTNYYEYNYGFVLYDKNFTRKTELITNRLESKKIHTKRFNREKTNISYNNRIDKKIIK